jgi:chromosome segregation protein
MRNGTARLKALELQGYKTFASKSVFEFAPTITAIVGPNGSGKSNIADALRWVLGEQSYSLLRGKRTEDMIFNGSDTRPRSSMASATIVFNNDDGWLPIDFSEVSIARRAYRDGQNEYYLNGQRVRLKDVNELLSQSGLAQRTYTIIGQGLVDMALSLKAEERRRLFEEAAGIGLYRGRKEETLRRLETTRRNLERIEDILTELRPRLRSLERQAKRAITYEQVKEDLNAILRVWYGFQWYQFQDRLADTTHLADEKRIERDGLRQGQIEADRELSRVRMRIETLRRQIYQWSQQVSEHYDRREALGRQLAVAKERIRWLADQDEQLEADIFTHSREIAELDENISSAVEEVRQKKQVHLDAQAALEQIEEDNREGISRREKYLAEVQKLRTDLEDLAGRKATWTAQERQLANRLEINLGRNVRSENSLNETKNIASGFEQKLAEIQERIKSAQAEHEQAIKEEKDAQVLLSGLQNKRREQQEHYSDRKSELAAVNARLEVLSAASKKTDRLTRQLEEEAKKGRLKGLVGKVSEAIRVDKKYQAAVSAALGEFGAALAFDSSVNASTALDYLKSTRIKGRAAILPLSFDTPALDRNVLDEPGSLGPVSSFVDAPGSYDEIIRLLIGRTLLVRDQRTAESISAKLPPEGRVVTLDGDLFFPGGAVLVGAGLGIELSDQSEADLTVEARSVAADLAGLQNEMGQIKEEIKGGHIRQSQARKAIEIKRSSLQKAQQLKSQLENNLGNTRKDLERLQAQLEELGAEKNKIDVDIAELSSLNLPFDDQRAVIEKKLGIALEYAEENQSSVAIAKAAARLQVSDNALQDAEIRRSDLQRRKVAVENGRREREERLKALRDEVSLTRSKLSEAEIGMGETERQIEALDIQIKPAEKNQAEAESQRALLENKESQNRATLQSAERAHSHAQIELARKQEEIASLRRRIEDDFGLVAFDDQNGLTGQKPLPFEGLVQRMPRVDTLEPDTEEQVNSLRAQLRRMGPVNPEARREHDEVRERSDFLNTQIEDLREAEEQMQEVIAELDLLMEREFRKTFDAVAINFREIFTRLFGGGSARLALTDDSDLTRSGIDIEARLPGRREQGLAMLSGGERSLTACALIFSLLKVSPTPFCVLDEVDAMLDESNVMRYREMLKELSDITQFVLITHNRQTVQASEVIYGISMGGDTASRNISLKLDEAEKVAVR